MRHMSKPQGWSGEQVHVSPSDRDKTEPSFRGLLPVWNHEWLQTGVHTSDPFAGITACSAGRQQMQTSASGRSLSRNERGSLMARFARIAAALSALATIFLVAGAGTKY